MFSYPSVLLLMSFLFIFAAGHFYYMDGMLITGLRRIGCQISPLMLKIPLSYGGFVLFISLSSHAMNLSVISYFIYLNFLPFYHEDRIRGGPLILIMIWVGSYFLTHLFFQEKFRDFGI